MLFEVKIAEFSYLEDFLKKYDELKSKNTRNLDPLVYLLSKLTEDREVCAGLGAGVCVLPGPCSLLVPWCWPLLTFSLCLGTEITHTPERMKGPGW